MDPLTIMMLAQLAPAAINLGKSGVQAYQAKQLGKTPRPTYEIPQAVQEATNNAKYVAGMTQLPGQNIMEDRLGRNTSNALADLKEVSNSPSQLGANLAKVYGNQMNAENNLGIQAGQNWMNNQGLLRNQLTQLGQAQNYQFDYNKNQPYQNNMAARSALKEGSFRNLSAGVGDLSKSGTALAAYLAAKQASEGGADGSEEMGKNNFSGGISGNNGANEGSRMDMNAALSMGGDGASGAYQYVDPNAIDNLQSNYGTNYKDKPYDFNYDYQAPANTNVGGNTNGGVDINALLQMIQMMQNPNSEYIRG